MLYRYVGSDPTGIPRVYADDEDADNAFEICSNQILEYVKARPDTGPVKKWKIGRDWRVK